MSDLVERLRDRANDKRPMPKPFNLLLDAAERISQQDAELERLRRELAAERESVADLAAETTRLTDAMIASRLAASEAREQLAAARKAAFIEAAEMAYAYECSLADYDGSVDAKHFYEGGVGDASIGISTALRAKAEETGRG